MREKRKRQMIKGRSKIHEHSSFYVSWPEEKVEKKKVPIDRKDLHRDHTANIQPEKSRQQICSMLQLTEIGKEKNNSMKNTKQSESGYEIIPMRRNQISQSGFKFITVMKEAIISYLFYEKHRINPEIDIKSIEC